MWIDLAMHDENVVTKRLEKEMKKALAELNRR